MHVRTTDEEALRAAVALAVPPRRRTPQRFRMAVADGWVSLYAEDLHEAMAFARALSAAADATVVQVAGRDQVLWVIHVAVAGASRALYRSDQADAAQIATMTDALGPLLAPGPSDDDALVALLSDEGGAHADHYAALCRLLGVSTPRMGFNDAEPLERLEFPAASSG